MVNAEPDHQRRDGSNSYLNPQLLEFTQGFTEIQGNPFQPSVDIAHYLGDLGESRLRPCPRQ
jgi:hypothetical protein